MRHRIIDTFTGPFALIQDQDGELATSWLYPEFQVTLAASHHDPRLLPDLARRLARYFNGKDVDFSDVPLPSGAEFFQKCWEACRNIPRGKTRGYGELARAAGGDHAAARAAGQAMRRNRLPIIIPCHRVIAADGRLHGFAGTSDRESPELGIKYALLRMEGAIPAAKHGPRATPEAPEAPEVLESLFAVTA